MAASPELRAVVGRMIDAGESEENIAAVIKRMTGADAQPSTRIDEPPAASMTSRVGSGAFNALKSMAGMAAKASGVPGLFREGPLGAIKDQAEVAKNVFYDAPAAMFEKARTAETIPETIGYAASGAIPFVGPMMGHAGTEIAEGRTPELIGEMAVGAALPLAAKGVRAGVSGARSALAARTATRAARALTEADKGLALAVPAKPEIIATARPYLNVRHAQKPITSTGELVSSLDDAIGEVEGRVKAIHDVFPEARLNPAGKVMPAVEAALKDNPRSDALATGVKELETLKLSREMTLPELDALRAHLNAENQGVLKRNNYDRATARKVDPAFRAREIAAKEIRDLQYDYLESRGVEGVRQLRRDEGALIEFRNAAVKRAKGGSMRVAATEPSLTRKVAGELADVTITGAGAGAGYVTGGPVLSAGGAVVGKQIGGRVKSAIVGGRLTRDQLVQRAFSAADERMPSMPEVPTRRTPAGALPPAPVEVGPSGAETSGPIPPTLPEHYVNPPSVIGPTTALAQLKAKMKAPAESDVPDFGIEDAPKIAPNTERAFMLRWLADDLKEMTFERGGTTPRMRREAEENYRPGDPVGARQAIGIGAAHVAGTPTQQMFQAMGLKGSRLKLAHAIERLGKGRKADPKLEALADAMREAWDGQRFDWQLVSDDTLAKTGLRRRDFKSPMTTPSMEDMPDVRAKFFGEPQ